MPKDIDNGYPPHTVGEWWRGVVNTDDGDGAIIKITNPTGWQAGQPIVFVGTSSSPGKDTTLAPQYQIAHEGVWSNLDVGDWLCKTGGVDWTDCGAYAGSSVTTVNTEYGAFATLLHEFDSMTNCQGDSGGPILGNQRGWGLVTSLSGTTTQLLWYSLPQDIHFTVYCGDITHVMALPRVLNALNVSLVTGG